MRTRCSRPATPAYLGVPMVGPDGSVQGILAVYAVRPRVWRPEEEEVLLALAATATSARMNAELYQGVSQEQQRSEAILANVADGIVAVDREGKVVLWNPAAERVTGVSAGRRTRADADGGARTAARGRGGRCRRQPARTDPPRRRGGVALAQRGRDDRSGRRGRGPDLRVPRHLRRAERRADEVGLRLDRLARAAHAAHVDLRLRRDAAPRGRPLRRGRAGHVPALHRVGVRAADRRSSTACSRSPSSTPATWPCRSPRPTSRQS